MDSHDELDRQWAALAPAWIKEAREGRNPTRNGLLDAPMLECCGDVRGLSILDCGCGEGRFSRMLLERGAGQVLGLDRCELMVEAARSLQADRDAYRVADVQDLSFLESKSFDLTVSYLNQCDLPDLAANNREVYRVLRDGGRFVVANLHPMRSALGTWHTDADGRRQHVMVDRYFDEGERRWVMMGAEITNFHRTLSTYISSFVESGFAVEGLLEPSVAADCLIAYPELADKQRVPNFIIYVLRKPGSGDTTGPVVRKVSAAE